MDFLIDFAKLFGRKIISYFIWVYLYCFLFSLETNVFVCSYIRTSILTIENNFHFFFLLFLFFVVYTLNTKVSRSKDKIFNYIYFEYLILCFKNISYSFLINTYYIKFKLNFMYFINLLSTNIFFIILNYCYVLIKNNILVWYPIYKSYSIFGFYKSTRLKFVDLKNENLKRFKY